MENLKAGRPKIVSLEGLEASPFSEEANGSLIFLLRGKSSIKRSKRRYRPVILGFSASS